MNQAVSAEIIAIGTEILLGEITDTNSVFLAKVLRDIGVNLYFMTSVGDNESRIEDAIRIAMGRADIVITCGGLGPTIDDMTRQGVARATDRELVFHDELLEQIQARFATFRSKMTENNKRQAYLPERSIVIENPVGTAPSFLVEHEGKIVISLPGVPREMKYLIHEWVVPHLQTRYKLGVIMPYVMKTAGIGESMLDELIGAEILESSNPTVGLAAHHGVIDIRVTAKAATREDAQEMIDAMVSRIRERVGQHIFGDGEQRIEDVLSKLLSDQQLTVSAIEVGIDAGLQSQLQASPEGYQTLKSYQHYEHPDQLAATHADYRGLNLRQLSEKAASTLREQSGSQYAIVIVSLPDVNENADHEYGSSLAVAHSGGVVSRGYGFGAKSEVIKEWLSRWALSSVWRMVKERA